MGNQATRAAKDIPKADCVVKKFDERVIKIGPDKSSDGLVGTYKVGTTTAAVNPRVIKLGPDKSSDGLVETYKVGTTTAAVYPNLYYTATDTVLAQGRGGHDFGYDRGCDDGGFDVFFKPFA